MERRDKMEKSVSAGGVVMNPEGRILVVSQRGVSWSLPKGHIEKGESPLETARREITEESGITELRFIKKLGEYSRYRMGENNLDDTFVTKKIILFLFKTNQEKLKPRDPKNPEARWVDKTEVANILTHQKDREFFRKIILEIK